MKKGILFYLAFSVLFFSPIKQTYSQMFSFEETMFDSFDFISPNLLTTLLMEGTASPPREYFAINALYLEDQKRVIHLGHDLINNTYVLMPSPNIISKEKNGDITRILVQFYFPEAETIVTEKYQVPIDKLQYLYIKSFEVYDQYGEKIDHVMIPPHVNYHLPQTMEFDIPANVKTISFIYSFVGRTGWSDQGMNADLKSLYKEMNDLKIDRDAELYLEVNSEEKVKTFEVFNHEEGGKIEKIISDLRSIIIWGEMSKKDEILQNLTQIEKLEQVNLDLNKGIEELNKYTEIFGNPPDEKLVSVIKKISSEKVTEEEHSSESGGSLKLGLDKIFKAVEGGFNKKRQDRSKRMVKYDIEGEFYIPKALNFEVRNNKSFSILKSTLLQTYTDLKEVTYHFGIGVSLSSAPAPVIPKLIVMPDGIARNYANTYRAAVNFECPESSALIGTSSFHVNQYEDRLFKFQCGVITYDQLNGPKNQIFKKVNCKNNDRTHNFDQPDNFSCQKDSFLVGEKSSYHGGYKDRQYGHTCCEFKNDKDVQVKEKECHWTNYVNSFDNPINFQCSQGEVLKGVQSVHSNHHEDRQFKFLCCSVF